MREIKFRAWDKKNKVMFIVELLRIFKDAVVNHGRKYSVYQKGYVCKYETELMQFTGLKDKNGKEIFEGDICKRPHYESRGEFNFVVKMNDPRNFTKFLHNLKLVEVIGNIYKNPEMIK